MMEYSNLFVVLMGMGIVFFGLVSIVVLISLMGKALSLKKEKPQESPQNQSVQPAAVSKEKMPQELVAAITCALAYELDARPDSLGIMSIEKIR